MFSKVFYPKVSNFIILILAVTSVFLFQASYSHAEFVVGVDGAVRFINEQPVKEDGENTPEALPSRNTIVVDGSISDWLGINPLITDPAGDIREWPDFINLYVTDDGEYVYFLYEFSDEFFRYAFLDLDTDMNTNSGCTEGRVGSEYSIVVGEFAFLGDNRDCEFGVVDFPDALVAVVSGRFVEASVPIDTLRILTPDITGFLVTTMNDRAYVAKYLFSTTEFDVTGQINLKSNPLKYRRVTLRQPDRPRQTTITDKNGFYAFENLVSGLPFTIIINGGYVP